MPDTTWDADNHGFVNVTSKVTLSQVPQLLLLEVGSKSKWGREPDKVILDF